jgi:negative regulator of sigma E activity
VKNLEYISAMVDEEAADASSSIDGLLGDAEARGAWQRYHLVRDVIQNEYNAALPTNFADLVREEIAFEAPHTNVVPLQAAARRPAPAEIARASAYGSPSPGWRWLPR